VHDQVLVAVAQTRCNLLKEKSRMLLVQLLSSAHVAEHVASGAELHNKTQVRLGFEGVKQFNDVPVLH
jgi:hypothetical protein